MRNGNFDPRGFAKNKPRERHVSRSGLTNDAHVLQFITYCVIQYCISKNFVVLAVDKVSFLHAP
jgi:hypothetical protein